MQGRPGCIRATLGGGSNGAGVGVAGGGLVMCRRPSPGGRRRPGGCSLQVATARLTLCADAISLGVCWAHRRRNTSRVSPRTANRRQPAVHRTCTYGGCSIDNACRAYRQCNGSPARHAALDLRRHTSSSWQETAGLATPNTGMDKWSTGTRRVVYIRKVCRQTPSSI